MIEKFYELENRSPIGTEPLFKQRKVARVVHQVEHRNVLNCGAERTAEPANTKPSTRSVITFALEYRVNIDPIN